MNTKVIFNLPRQVKEAAGRRAKREGLTLSTVLVQAARAYGSGALDVSVVDARPLRPAVMRDLKSMIADANCGKNISPSFTNASDAIAWLKNEK